jgi:hypothetical protein
MDIPVLEHTRPRRGRLSWVIVIAVYVVLTAWMTYPQVLHLRTGLSSEIGDPFFSTWRLAWIAHQLPRNPLQLFDANIFYPERHTLAYSDALLVPSLVAAPLIWMGVPPLLTYNLVFLAAFALSGAAMFLLVRSLTEHDGAAFIAGFVFAFLPFRYMHYAHLELQMMLWMPLCLWALHRTLASGRLQDGLLTGLFLALQLLSCSYYGIFLATYLVPVGIVLLAAERRHALRAIRALAVGALLTLALFAPVGRQYFAAREIVGERPVSEIVFYSAEPMDYAVAHLKNATFGPLTYAWGTQERELFQGIAVPLLALLALWPPLSAVRIAYAVGLLVALEISFGMKGVLYPLLHAYVLPYRGLRVPARMAVLVGFSLAILCGFTVARLCRLTSNRRKALAIAAAIFAVVYVEYRTRVPVKDTWAGPPPVYDLIPPGASNVILNLPVVRPDIAFEPTYMYFSTRTWQTLANGYSGFTPPSYRDFVDLMATFPDPASLAAIRQRSVDYVIVHGYFFREGEYVSLLERLDTCSELERIGSVVWGGRESRVYRVVK